MDLYEYQGKELFRRVGIPVGDGRLATTPDEARAGGRGARRPRRRQGAGADRRPRQGGRRQARREPPRGRGAREEHPRARHQGPRRQAALDRAGVGHREGVLPLAHVRPGRRRSRCSCSRRRAGSTSSRSPPRAPRRSSGSTSTRSRASTPGRRAGSSTAPGSTDPSEQKQIAKIIGQLYDAFIRFDAMLCEINPLIVTPDGDGQGARLEVHGRRQRALPAPGDRRDARRGRGRPARGARPREARHLREARRRGRRAAATVPG